MLLVSHYYSVEIAKFSFFSDMGRLQISRRGIAIELVGTMSVNAGAFRPTFMPMLTVCSANAGPNLFSYVDRTAPPLGLNGELLYQTGKLNETLT